MAMKRSRATIAAVLCLLAAAGWAIWSYATGGFVYVLFADSGDSALEGSEHAQPMRAMAASSSCPLHSAPK